MKRLYIKIRIFRMLTKYNIGKTKGHKV